MSRSSNSATMNHVERFRAIMRYQPVDRLPRWEWAMWWDQTIANWKRQGLPEDLNGVFETDQYFGLDPFKQFWFSTTKPTLEAVQNHTEHWVETMDDYVRIVDHCYPDHAEAIEQMRPWAKRQSEGEVVCWCTLEGFFWWPRTLMGLEKLCYAYYDQPELIHRMNQDLCAYNLRVIEDMLNVCKPTFITLAEDMSYNHGPMISQPIFEEFLAPYYRRVMERLANADVIVIVDTDGDPTMMVPWLLELGVEGILPLERQAGVDGMVLRDTFPKLGMVGHFNKMIMDKGEAAIREEFERLMPLMRSGGFIPSVDHQTPPHITLEQYRLYRRLLDEYTVAAAQ